MFLPAEIVEHIIFFTQLQQRAQMQQQVKERKAAHNQRPYSCPHCFMQHPSEPPRCCCSSVPRAWGSTWCECGDGRPAHSVQEERSWYRCSHIASTAADVEPTDVPPYFEAYLRAVRKI